VVSRPPDVLRVAAIEVGHWHSLHDAAYLRILAATPGVELVGLHDPSPEVVARRAAAVGGPPVFTDHVRMLETTTPDFVVALGPHARMARTALDLIERGVAFMMEKPMGLDATEVEAIATRAAARNAFVAVPLPQRYSPFVARVRAMQAEGRFGPLSHVYLRLNRPTSARYPAWDSPWMLDPALAGGGCLRNLGSHCFDLFRLVTGEEAAVTAAQLSARALGQPVEDYASVQLRTAGGVLGTIELGNTVPYAGSDGEFKVAGRDAILVSYHDDTLRVVTTDGEELTSAPPAAPLYPTAVRDILDHWRRGAPPPVSVHDLLPVVRLIDQAYARAGRVRP
jgi:predicted dehydrogenase